MNRRGLISRASVWRWQPESPLWPRERAWQRPGLLRPGTGALRLSLIHGPSARAEQVGATHEPRGSQIGRKTGGKTIGAGP